MKADWGVTAKRTAMEIGSGKSRGGTNGEWGELTSIGMQYGQTRCRNLQPRAGEGGPLSEVIIGA
jgi:hypothetical protein